MRFNYHKTYTLPNILLPLLFLINLHVFVSKPKNNEALKLRVVSSCVLCPLFPYLSKNFAKNVGNNINREETYSREACTCDEVMSF